MKPFIIFLLVFVAFLDLNAQNLQPQKAKTKAFQSSKAENLLDQVSEKVKSYDNIVIEFEYSVRDMEAGVEQETRGNVALKGEKYRLELMGSTRLFDGEKIYTIIPEDEEVNISTYVERNDKGLTPSKMLTFYEDGYDFKWDIDQNVHGRKIQYIKLTPTDPENEVDWILLGIDEQTKHIYKLINQLDDGRQISIEINSFKTNQPLSKTLFSFEEGKYEDYYINRLD